MIGRLFDRKPGYEAQVLAEAQAFIDDGLDIDFVLGLFPEDAEWLEGLLETSIAVTGALESEPASYYFEASLKSRFLEGARRAEPAPVLLAAPSYSPARTAVASMSVLASAAAIGVVAVGFITSANAVPGDWNYAFKQANERFEYTLSRGDSRVDVQLRQAEERVHELQMLSSRGNVSVEALKNLQREINQVKDLAQDKPLDPVQRARAMALTETTKSVLSQVRETKPELDQEAAAAAAAADDLVTVALGPEPTPAVTATSEPTATPEPTADPTATEEPATETPDPEATSTQQPSEAESPASGTVTP